MFQHRSRSEGKVERWYRKSTGFTLIELMIVILIIAILVAIAVPIYIAATNNAKKRTCQANLRSVDGAVAVYLAVEETEDFPDLGAMHGFFKSDAVPHCPSGDATYVYGSNNDASCLNAPDHYYP